MLSWRWRDGLYGLSYPQAITTLLVAQGLVNYLGIETDHGPIARNIKRQVSWNITNVEGVYGDCDAGAPISNIVHCDGTWYDVVVDWCYGIELAAVTTSAIGRGSNLHMSCAMTTKLHWRAPTGAGGGKRYIGSFLR